MFGKLEKTTQISIFLKLTHFTSPQDFVFPLSWRDSPHRESNSTEYWRNTSQLKLFFHCCYHRGQSWHFTCTAFTHLTVCVDVHEKEILVSVLVFPLLKPQIIWKFWYNRSEAKQLITTTSNTVWKGQVRKISRGQSGYFHFALRTKLF